MTIAHELARKFGKNLPHPPICWFWNPVLYFEKETRNLSKRENGIMLFVALILSLKLPFQTISPCANAPINFQNAFSIMLPNLFQTLPCTILVFFPLIFFISLLIPSYEHNTSANTTNEVILRLYFQSMHEWINRIHMQSTM